MPTGVTQPHPLAAEIGEPFERSWAAVASQAGACERIFGASAEGRSLVAYDFGRADAPVVLLTALMHGIEVIGSAALQALVGALAHRQDLLAAARYMVVPVVNPDAYHENARRIRAGQRAWQRCNGRRVDLNRNFPAMAATSSFHPFAGSRFPAAPHYSGPHAFSEPETQALRDLVLGAPPSLSLGFHSFGNLLLYPWGFTRAPHPREREYRRLCDAFNARASQRYRARQAVSLYPTSGDLDDWLDAHFDCRALTIEVGGLDWRLLHPRRLANPFFWMNSSDIAEVTRNVVQGCLGLIETALDGHGRRARPDRSAEPRLAFDLAAR